MALKDRWHLFHPPAPWQWLGSGPHRDSGMSELGGGDGVPPGARVVLASREELSLKGSSGGQSLSCSRWAGAVLASSGPAGSSRDHLRPQGGWPSRHLFTTDGRRETLLPPLDLNLTSTEPSSSFLCKHRFICSLRVCENSSVRSCGSSALFAGRFMDPGS